MSRKSLVVVVVLLVVLVGAQGSVQNGGVDCCSLVRELYPETRDDIASFVSAVYNATLACIACARESQDGLQRTAILQDVIESVGSARDNMVKQVLYFDMAPTITASALDTWSTTLALAAADAAEAANIPADRIASDPTLVKTVVDQGFQATLLSPRFFSSFTTSLRNQSLRYDLVMRSLAACDTNMLTLLGETWTAGAHGTPKYTSCDAAAGGIEEAMQADLHWLRSAALSLCQRLLLPTPPHPTTKSTPPPSCGALDEGVNSADTTSSTDCEHAVVSDDRPPPCSRVLPVVNADASTAALRRHFRFGVPAVIRTSRNADDLRELLSWAELPTTFAGEDLTLSTIPYGHVFGVRAGVATAEEYQQYTVDVLLSKLGLREQDLSQEMEASACRQLVQGNGTVLTPAPLYIFDHAALSRVLPNQYRLPPAVERVMQQNARAQPVHQLIIGPPCSGSPLHFHQNAVNVLLSGTKQWWLQPPVLRSYSKLHPLLARLGPPTCTQEEGDIMFVPRGWAHATLNMRHVSGFAIEM